MGQQQRIVKGVEPQRRSHTSLRLMYCLGFITWWSRRGREATPAAASEWGKQAVLARAVGVFTGVHLKKADAEYIGNAQDYYLRDYVKKLSKAHKAESKAVLRASKSGKETLASSSVSRVAELQLQIYKCKFGGVPRNIVFNDGSLERSYPAQPKQQVPFRTVCHADDMNCELLKHIGELKEQCGRERREMNHTLNAMCGAVQLEKMERKRVEHAAAKSVREQVESSHKELAEVRSAAKLVADMADHWKHRAEDCKRKCEDSERERQRKEGEVLRLQGKLVRAFVEAEDEQRKRLRAELAADKALALLQSGLEEARNDVEVSKQQFKMLERECQMKEGEVLRLEGKLVRAFAEADDEQRKRKRVEAAADKALALVRSDLEEARSDVDACKQQLKVAQRVCTVKEGEVFRLQSKLGHALVGTVTAEERANRAQTLVGKLKQELAEQQEAAAAEKLHLRELKNNMAKEKRDAMRRASTADQLQRELEAARKKLQGLRKEVNASRVRLIVEGFEEGMIDDECSEDGSLMHESGDEINDPNVTEEMVLTPAELAAKAKADRDAAKARARAVEAEQALTRMGSMPTWRPNRGKGNGKGAAKIEWGVRLVIYALIALMVPPSAIGMVIVIIVKHTAPWLSPAAPTCETIQRCRFELRFLEEALAARRVASAYRLRSLGFDETTKVGNTSLTSNVQIEPEPGAKFQDVILRAAYCPLGGTSELITQSIERKCFSRLRELLRRWHQKFKEMYPSEEWTGPDPALCSLHRLGGGGALISDTCNGARLAKQLLAELIAQQVEEKLGSDTWDAMSESERKAAVRTHNVDCWQHLRNIFLAEMSRAQAEHVKNELRDEIQTFATWERMSTDFSQLLRASFKEFHHSCRYYKGHGRSFNVWLRETYPRDFSLHLERADGGRQDLDYDAAVPLYVDRKYFVEYLHHHVFAKDHKNILEDFLYVVFRSLQYVAMTRANAIIDLLISRPMRWLSGKSSELSGWSPYSMGRVLDIVEQFFERAQHDGSLFLDAELDLFHSIAEEQPLFKEWRRFCNDEDHVLSPDGSTRHLLWRETRKLLLEPTDSTDAATQMKVIEYLEVQCQAGLRKMHDQKLAIRDKLSSMNGANCVGNTVDAHDDTIACHATNDALAEGVFGTYDMVLRRCQGISMEAASGVAQALRSQMLGCGDFVARRKQSTRVTKADYVGFMYSLPPHEQEALVECARVTVNDMRDIDRGEHAALDNYHKMRRQRNEEDALDALFTRYALALSFFERWVKRGVHDCEEMRMQLRGFGNEGQNEQAKLDWLREQIEMRVVGLSWSEWKTPWSSSKDESVGTIGQLTTHLEEVLAQEASLGRRGDLPSKSKALDSESALAAECPAPQFRRKTFKSLGTPTVQASELSNDAVDLTSEDVLAAAQKRRADLKAAGEIDWVSDRQHHIRLGKAQLQARTSSARSWKFDGDTGTLRLESQSTFGAKAKLCRCFTCRCHQPQT